MQDYHYHFEIRTLLTHFAAAFNEVLIKRYDGRKYAKEVIKVPLTYAPKSHILADMIGLTDTVRLPIMAVEIKSQGRDNARVKNKLDDLVYKNNDDTFVNLKAVPWNIGVEMTILAKYQEDMDQIIENIAVQSNPYIVVSWQEPKSGREMRTEILMEGDIATTYPGKNQGAKDPPFRITTTINFTIKGHIFQSDRTNATPICFVNTDYVFTDKFYCNYDTLVHVTDNATTENYGITGRPVLRYIKPWYVLEGRPRTMDLDGYSLGKVNGLFLSASNPAMFPMTEHRPFTALDAFSAFAIPDFQRTDTTLTFTMPAPSADGFLEVIAVNSCGYGKLTEDADRCGRVENPYPIDDPEHYTWTVAQFPFLNGVIVANFFDPYYINNADEVYQYIETGEVDRDTIIIRIKQLMELGQITTPDLV